MNVLRILVLTSFLFYYYFIYYQLVEKPLKCEPNFKCKLENYYFTADRLESAGLQKSTEKMAANALTFIHRLKKV